LYSETGSRVSLAGTNGGVIRSRSWAARASGQSGGGGKSGRGGPSGPTDVRTGQVGRPNRWRRRQVWDVPMFGHRVALDIEYLEIVIGARTARRGSSLCGGRSRATPSGWPN